MQNNKQTKFESVEQLENAYNALQAEFTKRCQLISELKRTIEQLQEQLSNQDDLQSISEQVKSEIIGEYLLKLANAKKVNTLSQNVGKMTVAPSKKPKTLQEAKMLADIMIAKE